MKNQLKELIKALWGIPMIHADGEIRSAKALEDATEILRRIVLLRAQIRLAP